MNVSKKYFAVSILASVSHSAVAQGVTFDELAAHITKTNPTYQSIELQPKQAELRRNAAVAEDWWFNARSGYQREESSDSYSYAPEYSKNWDNSISLERYSQMTGMRLNLDYSYWRYRSAYQRSNPSPSSSSSYSSNISASVSAPLWSNAFGYVSRRSLQQNEIQLEASRLSYLSERQSFMSRTQRQFTALCFFVAAESLTVATHQRAAALASAAKLSDGAEVGRQTSHALRFEQELAAALISAQRAREALQSDLATEYDYPRLKTEQPSCTLDARHSYASSDAEFDKMIGATRSMQALAYSDRSLELSKEITYNLANPRLDLAASYYRAGSDDDEWEKSLDEDRNHYRIALNFSYPLGNTRAHIQMDLVDLERIKLENTKRERLLNLRADFRRHALELQGIEKEIEQRQQQVEAARTAREQDARLAVSNGRLDISLYEDSLRKELDAQFTLLVAQHDYQFAYQNYQDTVSTGSTLPASLAPVPPSISVPRDISSRIFR